MIIKYIYIYIHASCAGDRAARSCPARTNDARTANTTVALLTIASAISVVVANSRGKNQPLETQIRTKRYDDLFVPVPEGGGPSVDNVAANVGVAMTEPPRYEPPDDDNFDIDEPLDDDDE